MTQPDPRPSRTMAGALTNDVSDAFLAILTNGKVTEDKVGPHGDLLAEFPYSGAAAQRLKSPDLTSRQSGSEQLSRGQSRSWGGRRRW